MRAHKSSAMCHARNGQRGPFSSRTIGLLSRKCMRCQRPGPSISERNKVDPTPLCQCHSVDNESSHAFNIEL